VPLATAGLVLEELLAAPGVRALVLTEVNPTHDPAGTELSR
jgi:arginase